MSIEIKSITKLYDQQKALDNVSFSVPSGKITGFLGPNGAGKSTLMKIITCFLPPTTGEAWVEGVSIYEDPLQIKKMIGYLPEHNPLYLDMYVKEFLRFAAGLHGLSAIEQKVKKVIEMTGLEIEQNKKIGSLSKGYRQRVGLAQALIHDPKVLILDEPTSGLDPVQIQEIRRLIKQLGEEKTVILSTHIMQEVEALCDHVVIINRGKIVADNDVSELKKIQKGREVVMIELDKKVKKQELEALSSVASVEVMPGQKWRITVKKDADFRKELFEWTMKNGLTVISLQSVSGSMEELFKQLTIRNN